MNSIINILTLLQRDTTINFLINKLGKVHRVLNNISLLTPIDKNINGISIMPLNQTSIKLGVDLKNGVVFDKVVEFLKTDFNIFYNHFDEETTIIFRKDNIQIICLIEGYFEENEVKNKIIYRFNFLT